MINVKHISWLFLSLIGCSSSMPNNGSVETVEYEGFQSLSVPRAEIPIGARWEQGIGPVGHGAHPHELRASPSLSTLTSNSTLDANVRVSIASWLGLSTSQQQTTKLSLSDVEIVSVPDLFVLGIQPGNHVLFEAIRVGRITLSRETGVITDIESSVLERLQNSQFNISAKDSNALTLDGDNLYVAYRVVTLNEPNVERSRKRFTSIKRTEIANYSVSFNINRITNCACGTTPESNPSGHDRGPHCLEHEPLQVAVENLYSGMPGSGGERRMFDYYLRANQPSVVIGSRTRSGYIEVDRLTIDAKMSNMLWAVCRVLEGYEFDSSSQMELATIQYRYRTLSRPQAPGW